MGRKIFIFTAVILFFSVDVFSDGNVNFNFLWNVYEVDLGILSSLSKLEMNEYVYASEKSGKKISELDWNPGFCAGLGMKGGIRPKNIYRKLGLFFDAEVLWYMTTDKGSVLDVDWDYYGNKYSEAACGMFFDGGMKADGNLQIGIPLGKNFLLAAGAGVWYGRFSSKAIGGKINQVNPGESWMYKEEYKLYGVSMLYIQEWIVLKPDWGIKFFLGGFDCDVMLSASPFVWGDHVDSHYFKKIDRYDEDQKYIVYEDKVERGLFLNFSLNVLYRISKYSDVGFFVEFISINDSRGDTKASSQGLVGYGYIDKGMAGSDLFVSDFGIRFCLKL